jgi:hypothetical protein
MIPSRAKSANLLSNRNQNGGKGCHGFIDALDGTLSGLTLSTNDVLSFSLRLHDIPVHVWIGVMPQIIARANTESMRQEEKAVSTRRPRAAQEDAISVATGIRTADSRFSHLTCRYLAFGWLSCAHTEIVEFISNVCFFLEIFFRFYRHS